MWLIRCGALLAWLARDGTEWRFAEGRNAGHLSEVAARMALNDRWEFDEQAFCGALDELAAEESLRER